MQNGEGEFELFGLKVTVVAPAGAAIYCSAKSGDYFELHGEMLIPPPGQRPLKRRGFPEVR